MMFEETIATLERNAERIAPDNGIKEKLVRAQKEGRPLRVKLGFDPTAPDLHLGHAVVLRKLKEFQDLGHQIVLLVGGFTARIGDPTGRNKMRPPLQENEIKKNAQTYLNQFGKIIDTNRVEVRDNSEWLDKLSPTDIIKLMSQVTVGQILQRTDFNERYKNQSPIAMHEILYPLLQAYDSVYIRADIELGGSDQLFNCMLGRELQAAAGQEQQLVMCMPLLIGLDGVEKMSKSKGNYIGLTEPAADIYGKIMSIPDSLISNYLDLATNFDAETIAQFKKELTDGQVNPMTVKMAVAKNVATIYSSEEDAMAAERLFKDRFQQKNFMEKDFEDVSLTSLDLAPDASLLDVCKAIMPSETSNSQIRRLFSQNAVQVEGHVAKDPLAPLPPDLDSFRMKIGKKGFYRLLKS